MNKVLLKDRKAPIAHTETREKPLRVCMLAYTFYENDGRVMRYAESLARAGAEVDAIALRRKGQSREEVINGINVIRIQRREKNEKGKLVYLMKILSFLFLSTLRLTLLHRKVPYDVIHVHSVPDFEVFAAFFAKLGGAKIILDIHDIVPEFYAAKFGVSEKSLIFKCLLLAEKISASYADHVIISNELWREKIVSRSVSKDKCSTFINYPDLSVFHPSRRTRTDHEKYIVLYPGTLNWHQGLDIAIKAFNLALLDAPDMEFYIYGEGSARPALEKLINELNLCQKVHLKSPIPLKDISGIMANADLGIVPKRADSFGSEAFSTKILEFMALGVPLVVSATKVDKYYFNTSLLRFFNPGDIDELSRAIVDAYQHRETGLQLASRALSHAEENSWSRKEIEYLEVVEQLVNRPLVTRNI